MDKRCEQIMDDIEEHLDESWELIASETTLDYQRFKQARRIINRCKEIIAFFD